MHFRNALFVVGLFLVGARGLRAAPGNVEREIQVGGATRKYLIHVPPAWDRVRPLPVLFVFHGAGSDAESMVRATGFDALADASPDKHMLVVYPRAPAGVKRYEVDPPRGRVSADVLFVDALLERLRARFVVDPTRIWATGFSNGAALCYRLAAERPHVFAAIAPVAGYLPDLTRADPIVPVPLLHVHGTKDDRVGAPNDGPTSAVRTWARWNGAAETPVESVISDPSGLVLRHRAFKGASPRGDTRLLLVEGQGHTWSGGPGGAVTQWILQFLAAHPRQAAASPLVGQPFGALEALRRLSSDSPPLALSAAPLTVFVWWTHANVESKAVVLAYVALAERRRARGLRTVAVQYAEDAGGYLQAPFTVPSVFDDGRAKLLDLRGRGAPSDAAALAVLVDAQGIVRWVGSGASVAALAVELRTLDLLLESLLPAAPSDASAPTR